MKYLKSVSGCGLDKCFNRAVAGPEKLRVDFYFENWGFGVRRTHLRGVRPFFVPGIPNKNQMGVTENHRLSWSTDALQLYRVNLLVFRVAIKPPQLEGPIPVAVGLRRK